MTGGLDVLEVIGKKTFDVIAEGDGGIKSQIKKRKEKPNLSQVSDLLYNCTPKK